MSVSTDGIVAYGFNLGSDEEWLVEEVDKYGWLQLDWFGEADNDFMEAAERRLLAAAGFTETWSRDNEGYFQREREAKGRLGVRFVSYCSGEYPSFILATKSVRVSRGYVEPLDPGEMATRATPGGEDEQRLRHALGVLGLTPKQESPQWLLCSFWG